MDARGPGDCLPPKRLRAHAPTIGLGTFCGLNSLHRIDDLTAETGGTDLMATHDETIITVAQRSIRLKDGGIVSQQSGL